MMCETMKKPFNVWLQQTRQSLGLSQAQCAARIGLGENGWRMWESPREAERISRQRCEQIAQGLGIPAFTVYVQAGWLPTEFEELCTCHQQEVLDLILRLRQKEVENA